MKSVRRLLVTLLAGAMVSAVLAAAPTLAEDPLDGRDETVVVAVVDGSFQPHHWNWHASMMPQHADGDPSNDLPLDQAPDSWLPGFSTEGFSSYNRFDVALDEENPGAPIAGLQAATPWNTMQQSTSSNVHYYWAPDTKVVGMVRFGPGSFVGTNTAHGSGTSSVAAGNIHGTCPECVVVLVTYGGNDREAASNWAMSQPWIDVVTNSFGFSQVERERLYSGSNTDLQREASERGQTIFFSSGNGISNTFSVPNTTLFSSQEGPDWIMTVGGVSPGGGEYTGAGKPADVASVGSGYPSQYGGSTVSSQGNFSGTSNSTPVAAGMYARGLWWARQQLGGRTQADGVLDGDRAGLLDAARAGEHAPGLMERPSVEARDLRGGVRGPAEVVPLGPHPGRGVRRGVGAADA